MIPRLYDTDEGTVLVDGINVRDYGLKPLREGIGMVLQNNTLFSGSITENLKWGDEHADEKAVRKAAQNAQAAGFIDSFKDGYRTRLEQSGNNVSGGQKQQAVHCKSFIKVSENPYFRRFHQCGGYGDRTRDPQKHCIRNTRI